MWAVQAVDSAANVKDTCEILSHSAAEGEGRGLLRGTRLGVGAKGMRVRGEEREGVRWKGMREIMMGEGKIFAHKEAGD